MTLIRKLFQTFLSRAFITFCIIGVINTLLHLGVYNAVLAIPHQSEDFLVLLGNTLAFIIASLFSYWANATFTYREKMSQKTFWLAMVTFLIRLFLSDLLIYICLLLIREFGWTSLIPWAPLPASIILIPIQFLVFNIIFKQKNKSN
ncbi:MAG: GtrA family protein [Bacilli bacterium]|jgi:putative flippase GtrA|nr:GtrA family protein [Bacilli bacterium]MDY0064084.1 GtrA family protein [Bacilli bacterium]